MKKILSYSFAIAFAVMLVGASTAHAAFQATCSPDFNGQYFPSKPAITQSLCTTGSPSQTIEGSGSTDSPWKWHCFDDEGNQGDRCEAFQSFCGNNIVEDGEQCDGGAGCSASCEMAASCNASLDGQALVQKPTTDLCAVGNPSNSVGGDGTVDSPWVWNCFDFAGNNDSSCRATQKASDVIAEEVVETENNVQLPEGGVTDSMPTESVTNTRTVTNAAPAATTCNASDRSDITGYIWHDTNHNGERDDGEAIIEDVTVELLDEDGNEIDEDETNTKGKFSFRDYAAGKYIIDVKSSDRQLEGLHQVYEPDNNLNGKDRITLKCNNDHTGTSFGYDTDAAASTDRPATLSQTGAISLFERFLALL